MAYPKPDAERRNRVEPRFGWVDLPVSSGLSAPVLPLLRVWTAETLRWWAELWAKGQATMWDRSGSSAVPMAVLYDALQDAEAVRIPGLLAELRQHEDRHGLTPKAMLQLRWRFADGEASGAAPVKRTAKTDRRKRVLQAVPNAST